MGSRRSLVRIQSSRPCAPVVQLDRMAVFETAGWRFESSQVLQISISMNYLLVFLFLLLISCTASNCKVDPNATVQVKTDTRTTDVKMESRTVVDQIRELKDGLQPGAQFRCKF